MSLDVYASIPLIPGNKVGKNDTYIGDGTKTNFLMANNTSTTVGDTIQADLSNFTFALGGFTLPDSTHFTLLSAPACGAQINAPARSTLTIPIFDQVNVSGITSPANVVEIPFWIGDDGSNIQTNVYQGIVGTPGIAILFQNLVTATGASVNWTQICSGNASGLATTYAATGTTFYTPNFSAFTTVAASGAALSTTLTVASASGFVAGDYILVNPSGGSKEQVQITSIAGNVLTVTGFNYAHFTGENVFVNCRKFFVKVTMPVNILGGQAINLYNLGLRIQAIRVSRF